MTKALIANMDAALREWASFADDYWYSIPGKSEYGCFGTGYDNWGVQTAQKHIGVMAYLATVGGGDAGFDREWALERALAALRFNMDSHKSGPFHCTDGKKWGHTWISALGIERMMYGVQRLLPHLTDADKQGLRRMLISEADWTHNHFTRGAVEGMSGSRWAADGKNHPESNLWEGALLWRVATMYPDHPDAEAWQEKARCYLINAVSVAADATNETIVDGKPVRERFRGDNFFPSYALDHHRYLNVGYMAICVSNAAMLYFDMKASGSDIPESLHHRQDGLWQTLRRMVFADGRLARIGGDSRSRYVYCQDYLLPSLLYAADHMADPHAAELIKRQWQLFSEERRFNGDGSFFGKRLAYIKSASPYYYTRLESDRAAVLAMALNWLPLVTFPHKPRQSFEESAAGLWIEKEHGAVMHRSPRRLASFAWRACGLTQAMCQPPDDSSLAEWELNLAGYVEFQGDRNVADGKLSRRLLAGDVQGFDGGFISSGAVVEGAKLFIAEGWRGEDSATNHIAVAALPDGRTMVGLQLCRAANRRVFLKSVKGIHLNLPNDLFNGFKRCLHTASGTVILKSPAKLDGDIALGSRWVNVEDKLGLILLTGADTISVSRSSTRRGGVHQSLYVDQLCAPCCSHIHSADAAAILLDSAWAVLASASVGETETFAATHTTASVDTGAMDVRALQVTGADDNRYLFIANFSATSQKLECGTLLADHSRGECLATGKHHGHKSTIDLAVNEARLLRMRKA